MKMDIRLISQCQMMGKEWRSYLTVKNGIFENKIQFYDFSNSGKNIENRMVKEFSGYGETIVPTISYVSNSQVVAIGEDIVSIYKVGNKDITKKDIKIKEEIQKVFYNDKYVGLVFKNASTDRPYRIEYTIQVVPNIKFYSGYGF